jgi:hypothetical protein
MTRFGRLRSAVARYQIKLNKISAPSKVARRFPAAHRSAALPLLRHVATLPEELLTGVVGETVGVALVNGE